MLWTELATITRDATIGRGAAALGNAPDPFVWDEGNTINITLIDPSDTLSSVTEDEVLEGNNLGMLGDEVIQWQYATLEGDGSYTLSRLLRGRGGTEWACGSHIAGENFVVLNFNKLTFVPMNIDDKNRYVQFKTTSVEMPVNSFVIIAAPIHLRNLKPLSPQHATGTRDGSGDVIIGWVRRTRIGGEWQDGQDVILGELSELYAIDIYDGSTLVRTITGLITPTFTYTDVMQVTDFGSAQSAVDVDIYQISNVIGRGFGLLATI